MFFVECPLPEMFVWSVSTSEIDDSTSTRTEIREYTRL